MTRKQSDRRISIRSILRNPPDYQKLGRAFIALAQAQNEAEAKAQADEAKAKQQADEGDETARRTSHE